MIKAIKENDFRNSQLVSFKKITPKAYEYIKDKSRYTNLKSSSSAVSNMSLIEFIKEANKILGELDLKIKTKTKFKLFREKTVSKRIENNLENITDKSACTYLTQTKNIFEPHFETIDKFKLVKSKYGLPVKSKGVEDKKSIFILSEIESLVKGFEK